MSGDMAADAARQGRQSNQPALGVLMLETRFPRPRGDVGNPGSFAFPVRYQVVAGASPRRVVREEAAGLLQPFIDAGHALIAQGCVGITTSCGFLVLFQRALAAALQVPVLTSSLLQIAGIERSLPAGRRAGVVTISAESLGPAHWAAADARADTPVQGVAPESEFAQRILGDQPQLDVAQAERDVVAAAQQLIARHPEVGALVLECTNMPPYADAVRRATGLPVFDALSAIEAFWHGIAANASAASAAGSAGDHAGGNSAGNAGGGRAKR